MVQHPVTLCGQPVCHCHAVRYTRHVIFAFLSTIDHSHKRSFHAAAAAAAAAVYTAVTKHFPTSCIINYYDIALIPSIRFLSSKCH